MRLRILAPVFFHHERYHRFLVRRADGGFQDGVTVDVLVAGVSVQEELLCFPIWCFAHTQVNFCRDGFVLLKLLVTFALLLRIPGVCSGVYRKRDGM